MLIPDFNTDAVILDHYQGLHIGSDGPYPMRVTREHRADTDEVTWVVADPQTGEVLLSVYAYDPLSPMWEHLRQWMSGETVRYHEPAPAGLVEKYLTDDYASFDWGAAHAEYIAEVEAYNKAWEESGGN